MSMKFCNVHLCQFTNFFESFSYIYFWHYVYVFLMVVHCICFVKEKDLIHKLFKVLVPRYQNYETSFTQTWNLPIQYPGKPIPRAILELKG